MTSETVKETPKETEVAEKVEEIEVSGLRVDLLPSFVRVYLANGVTRDVSHEEFTKSLLGYYNLLQATEEVNLDLKLPRNTYRVQKTSTGLILGQYYPESIQQVNYNETVRPSITPNIIITSILSLVAGTKNDYKLDNATYWATSRSYEEFSKDIVRRADHSRHIGLLPFTNVYDEGHLCYGNNSVTRDFKAGNLLAVRTYYDVLWHPSIFNNDLGVRALRNQDRDYSIPDWYTKLANCAKDGLPFPYADIGI